MPRMPIRQHNDAVYDFWELQEEFNYSLNHYYGLNDILNDFNKHIELIEEYRKNINDNSTFPLHFFIQKLINTMI